MPQPTRILHIDDDAEDRYLMARALAAPGWPDAAPAVAGAGRLEEGVARLGAEPHDIVLLDLLLPDAQGLEAFRRLREAAPGVPIIVITALRDEGLGLQAVALGAQDFLSKDRIEPAGLRRAVCFALARARLAEANLRLDRLRAEIRERRRLDKQKDRLMSAVAHELRSPLSIIHGVLDNLKLAVEGRLEAADAELLELAFANSRRMRRYLDRFLDLSRLENGGTPAAGKVAPLPVLREAVSGFTAAARGRPVLHAELLEPLPAVAGDADSLAEVVNNLLANALRFARTRVLLRARASDSGGLLVSVLDDGPGLPAGPSERLFSKFHQAERRPDASGYKGTGLGLALSRQLVARRGGRIWAEPAPGGGAAFHVELPPSSEPTPPRPAGGRA